MSYLDLNGDVVRGTFELTAALSMDEGEVFGILGPNGSGKSTMLGAISGVYPLSSGTLTVAGETWDDSHGSRPIRKRSIGSMTATGDLFPQFKAIDNVAFGLRMRGHSKADAREIAGVELEKVGMADYADRRPNQMSTGQCQRVALARALSADPDVLLLDEPFAAIDPSGRTDLRQVLGARLADSRAATLLITHDPLDALTLTDRLCFLEDGHITQIGTPSEVVAAPRTEFAAGVVGLNLWHGVGEGTHVKVEHGPTVTSVEEVSGPAFAAFSPSSVSLWPTEPEGSPRNVWPVVVRHVENTGAGARVYLDCEGASLFADVTLDAVAALRLSDGQHLFATVKATDVRAYPAA